MQRLRRAQFFWSGVSNKLASCSIIAPPSCSRIHDRDGPVVVAGHVVPDSDGDQLDGRAPLDPLDDLPQVPLQIGAAIADAVESSTGAPSK